MEDQLASGPILFVLFFSLMQILSCLQLSSMQVKQVW